MKNRAFIFFLLILVSCAHHPAHTPISIALIDNNHSLTIAGFDKAIIDDIGRDSSNDVWQALLPVYKMPADTDMKDFQSPQPGKYSVKDSSVFFTPDTAFQKGQAYFVRYYQYDKPEDAWQYLREKKRQSAAYKHLNFSY